MTTIYPLSQLGWNAFFQQQLTLDEYTAATPARIIAKHRSQLEIYAEQGRQKLIVTPHTAEINDLMVGDWVLLQPDGTFHRMLERRSRFTRKAAGKNTSIQNIAANVDTAFITTALNQDFSLNRIERYLALVSEAGADAVVVLTKADLCDDPDHYLHQVRAIDPMLMVEVVNALDPESTSVLDPWCSPGSTVALLGSSGVGKSTLVNTLSGKQDQLTGAARSADDKGRHTTTARSLHFIPDGGALLDTPGMRELQLVGCEAGIDQVFSDISALATQCRYSDCQHQTEPGCAVQKAVNASELDPRRVENYFKLQREHAFNAASLAEKRAKDRSLGRFYRSVKNEVFQRKKGDHY